MPDESLTITDNRTSESYKVPVQNGRYSRDGLAPDQDRARATSA